MPAISLKFSITSAGGLGRYRLDSPFADPGGHGSVPPGDGAGLKLYVRAMRLAVLALAVMLAAQALA